MAASINWHSLVFGSGWLQKLDKLAARRFAEGGLAEEATTYVIDKLSADEWQCLASFQGQCKPESYLYTVTSNYLEEFARKRFGRLRAPEWLKQQGTLWLQVWKMICLERQLIPSVIEHLCSKNIRDVSVIKNAITTIKARLPWCGSDSHREQAANTTEIQDDYNPTIIIATNDSPERELTETVYADSLLLISSLMNDKPVEAVFGDNASALAANYLKKNKDKITMIQQKLQLTDEEKIVLRMFFQDGLKKSVIAKSLGMQQHIPGRLLKLVLKRISQVFHDLNINLNDINELSMEFSD
ncbi:hypothetical protein MNBD_GAMMA22-1262 [hydrothermal vent metagenome]|uniref:Uncharacterized protein n=1 Tax=hydrothermal vent metagenome TaxID=652676 RepID=A0A3B0ZRQ1_9ZZZZ